jgi:hypothetical protein
MEIFVGVDISKWKLQTSEAFLNLKYNTHFKFPALRKHSPATW